MDNDRRPFAITVSNDTIGVIPGQPGQIVLTVTNVSGRRLTARPTLMTDRDDVRGWVQLEGDREQQWGPEETRQVTARVELPPGTQPGPYVCRFIVSNIANPDEEYTEGPQINLRVAAAPEPEKKRGFPWWILAVIGGVLLLVGGGIGVYFALQGGGSKLAGVDLEVLGQADGQVTMSATALDKEGEPAEEGADAFDKGSAWVWSAAPEGIGTLEPTESGAVLVCGEQQKGAVDVTVTAKGDEGITKTVSTECAARLTKLSLSVVGNAKIPAQGTALIDAAQLDQAGDPLDAVTPFNAEDQWEWVAKPNRIARLEPTQAGAKITCLKGQKGDITVSVSSLIQDLDVSGSTKVSCEAPPPRPPPPSADFTVLPASGQVPLTVQFVSKAPTAKSWSWNFGDGSKGSGVSPQHTYKKAGTFTVSIDVRNPDGQRKSSSKEGLVKVTAPPAPANFHGTWNSTFGQLRLIAQGNRVYGDYQNVGAIEGKYNAATKTSTGTFTNGNRRGRYEWTLSSDGFKGRWAWDGQPWAGSWNASRASASTPRLTKHRNFNANGYWNSTFGELRLRQDGTRVFGDYNTYGVIEAVLHPVTGQIKGIFTNGSKWGRLEFNLSSSNNWTGQWSWGGQNWVGAWNATKRSASTPRFTKASYVPYWQGTFNSTFGPLRLRQDGSRVWGDYSNLGTIEAAWNPDTNRIDGFFLNRGKKGKLWYFQTVQNGTFTGQWAWDGQGWAGAWNGNRTSAALPNFTQAEAK